MLGGGNESLLNDIYDFYLSYWIIYGSGLSPRNGGRCS